MTAYTKRAYPRCAHEAPIMCTDYDTRKYYHAKIYNSSLEGLYFESYKSLQPESDIYIKMINYAPDTPGPEAYRAYRAKVKWCKKIDKSVPYRYGIGIKHSAISHMVYDRSVQNDTYSCNLCGTEMPSGEIQETDDFVFLCISCFNCLEGLREGKIKESIKDFLLGNVI